MSHHDHQNLPRAYFRIELRRKSTGSTFVTYTATTRHHFNPGRITEVLQREELASMTVDWEAKAIRITKYEHDWDTRNLTAQALLYLSDGSSHQEREIRE